MSSYSKCRFCGKTASADFYELRMCKQCSISYLAGEEDAEAHIIKLLEDTRPENGFAMFTPEWAIALIRGRQNND